MENRQTYDTYLLESNECKTVLVRMEFKGKLERKNARGSERRIFLWKRHMENK